MLVVLIATWELWAARGVMRPVHPQGSMRAALQCGMLLSFAMLLACYSGSLLLVLLERSLK